jgi:hypothetical protein
LRSRALDYVQVVYQDDGLPQEAST